VREGRPAFKEEKSGREGKTISGESTREKGGGGGERERGGWRLRRGGLQQGRGGEEGAREKGRDVGRQMCAKQSRGNVPAVRLLVPPVAY